jgi:hypothetical protein
MPGTKFHDCALFCSEFLACEDGVHEPKLAMVSITSIIT